MIVISGKPGQLGNMLFLFAHFIAFGVERKITIKAPAFSEYADYFTSTHKGLIPSYPARRSILRGPWLRKLIYQISFLLSRVIFKLGLKNRLLSSVYLDWHESL